MRRHVKPFSIIGVALRLSVKCIIEVEDEVYNAATITIVIAKFVKGRE